MTVWWLALSREHWSNLLSSNRWRWIDYCRHQHLSLGFTFSDDTSTNFASFDAAHCQESSLWSLRADLSTFDSVHDYGSASPRIGFSLACLSSDSCQLFGLNTSYDVCWQCRLGFAIDCWSSSYRWNSATASHSQPLPARISWSPSRSCHSCSNSSKATAYQSTPSEVAPPASSDPASSFAIWSIPPAIFSVSRFDFSFPQDTSLSSCCSSGFWASAINYFPPWAWPHQPLCWMPAASVFSVADFSSLKWSLPSSLCLLLGPQNRPHRICIPPYCSLSKNPLFRLPFAYSFFLAKIRSSVNCSANPDCVNLNQKTDWIYVVEPHLLPFLLNPISSPFS